MDDDVKRAVEDVHRAREWAREHFHAYVDEEHTPSHLLARGTNRVTFPDVDRMDVVKIFYGEEMLATSAEYRLCWKHGRMYWKGGFLLRPDIVAYLEVKESR